jgi:hypothetical protein
MNAPVLNGSVKEPPQSLRAAVLFPKRTAIYPFEAAGALSVSTRQVDRWADEGEFGVMLISLRRKGCRTHYRIPVCEWDAFVGRRFSLNEDNGNGHSKNGKAAHR